MKHGIRAAALSMALALIFAMTACDGEAASAEQGRNIFSTMESGFGPVETGDPATEDESALKQEETEPPESPEPPETEQPQTPYVADAWNDGGQLRVPRFTLESEDAEQINRDILDTFQLTTQDGKTVSDAFVKENYSEITYEWNVTGNIVSLVVCGQVAYSDSKTWLVYNISVPQGKRLSREEVVAASALSDRYEQLVKEVLGSKYWDYYGDGFFTANDTALKSDWEKTTGQENLEEAQPYFNENGQLCVIGRYYLQAGPGYGVDRFNLEDFVRSPYYQDTYATSSNTTVTSWKYVVGVADSVYFHARPEDSEDNIVLTVPLNTQVGYIEDAGNGFSRVEYQGQYGYIKSEYLADEMQFDSFTGGEWYDGEHVVRINAFYWLHASPTYEMDVTVYIEERMGKDYAESLMVGDTMSGGEGDPVVTISSIEKTGSGYSINHGEYLLEYDADDENYRIRSSGGYAYSTAENGVLSWAKDAALKVPDTFGDEGTLSAMDIFNWNYKDYLVEITTKNDMVISAEVIKYLPY